MSIEIKQILQKLNTNPQKKLGQNFLINKNKIKKLNILFTEIST